MEERREEIYSQLGSLRDRITRLETMREGDDKGQAAMATQLIELTKAINTLALDINTIKTQRNTVIGVAGVIGACASTLAGWIFKGMTGIK